MSFNQEEFNDFIIENNIVGFFEEPIKLKSGRRSHWYVNWRKAAGDPYLLDLLTDYLVEFTKTLDLDFDCFNGVPDGATMTGVIASYKWAKQAENYDIGSHAVFIKRSKPKDHGKPEDQFYVGKIGKAIVFEDVTTTGGSLLTYLDKLAEDGIEVIAAVGATNREAIRDDGLTVKEAVEKKGIPYYAMSSAFDFLPKAFEKLNPGKDIVEFVKVEFGEYRKLLE
jgi:orotate phosphoribosyltransferase